MLKKGDVVIMHTCAEARRYDGETWICKTDEFVRGDGEQLVFLEGFSGYFATEYLKKVK